MHYTIVETIKDSYKTITNIKGTLDDPATAEMVFNYDVRSWNNPHEKAVLELGSIKVELVLIERERINDCGCIIRSWSSKLAKNMNIDNKYFIKEIR